MSPEPVERLLPDEAATAGLAARLAPHLRAGDTLLLSGEIGAGKTHFARALIQARLAAADRNEDVPSPTFTLVQTYDDGICEIWHADLYRLTDAQELAELGLDDAMEDAICLIEWPEQVYHAWPKNTLMLSFSRTNEEGQRRLRLDPRSYRMADLAARLAQG